MPKNEFYPLVCKFSIIVMLAICTIYTFIIGTLSAVSLNQKTCVFNNITYYNTSSSICGIINIVIVDTNRMYKYDTCDNNLFNKTIVPCFISVVDSRISFDNTMFIIGCIIGYIFSSVFLILSTITLYSIISSITKNTHVK